MNTSKNTTLRSNLVNRFAVAFLALGCAAWAGPALADASAPTHGQGAGGLGSAVPYLSQAAESVGRAQHEATVEVDPVATVQEIDDAITSLRTARALIVAPAP